MNNEQQNNTPEQPLEKSTKYIAGYLKFDLKKDMEEKPEPKDRAQLIDSLLEDPLHANFEVKFPMA